MEEKIDGLASFRSKKFNRSLAKHQICQYFPHQKFVLCGILLFTDYGVQLKDNTVFHCILLVSEHMQLTRRLEYCST